MNIYKQKFTKLEREIISLLCVKAGESLNQRTIAHYLKVSPTAVSKSLKNLKKEGIINIENYIGSKNVLSIELNRDLQKNISLKRIENLKIIYDSLLIDSLIDFFPGSTIILFGSYSRGEDITSSDIDIAIIGSKEKKISLEKFEKIFQRKININFYNSLKEININLRNNILNGIVLAGGIEI